MKKILLLPFFFITTEGWTQTGDSHPVDFHTIYDSILNVAPASDSISIREGIDRNITGILNLQKKQKERQKRAAMIRIGIGIAFFILLIVGLKRRRK